MVTKQDYLQVVDIIQSFCQRQHPNIIALYLGGSVARGDFVPGRSDIDLYVVTANKDAALEASFMALAEELGQTKLRSVAAIHPVPVGISFTTLDEIKDGNSFLGSGFEYRNFIKTGKLLYGEDVKPQLPVPTREQEQNAATSALQQFQELLAYPPPEGDMGIAMTFSLIFRGICTFYRAGGSTSALKMRP